MLYIALGILVVFFLFLLIFTIRIYREDKDIREKGKKMLKEQREEKLRQKMLK
jgi:predicted PurR-regulated permease PerM